MTEDKKHQQVIYHTTAENLIKNLDPESVDLVLTDPPYFGVVAGGWDNQWENEEQFISWFLGLMRNIRFALKPHASIVFFSGIGPKNPTTLLRQIDGMRQLGYVFRNLITWKKRRAYGKETDYLNIREEIAWFSVGTERENVRFNIPLTNEKGGYAGYNKKYPAKSEYKRVGNVWDDIPGLMRPRRNCEKPISLIERLVLTHSNPGDVVLDLFAGTGVTGVACKRRGREFVGCDIDEIWVNRGNKDIALTVPRASTVQQVEVLEEM